MTRNVLLVVLPIKLYMEKYAVEEVRQQFHQKLNELLPAGETDVSIIPSADPDTAIFALSLVETPTPLYQGFCIGEVQEMFKEVKTVRVTISTLIVSSLK